MAYIDTPRTEAANTTFTGNGYDLDDFSMEKSFHSPKKREPDLISHMRNNRGLSLRTPHARTALAERRNLQTNRRSGEFTPLLKSATKRNALKGKENVLLPNTPAFLKASFQAKESPALQAPESSGIYGSVSESFVEMHDGMTPLPQLPHVNSSSAQSTPLAALPSRTGDRMLDDQRNLMTLREQENIIDKIEKENFGLKLKIHFLEDLLRKSDPNLNQNALKENTDLHVDKATLQRDLARIKKQLTSSERNAEALKQQLQDGRERDLKDQVAQELGEEVLSLRTRLEAKDAKVDELQSRLKFENRDHGAEKLRGVVEDLEAELREKDRIIDSKNDELEILDTKLQGTEDLRALLASAQEEVKALEDLREDVETLRDEAQRAKNDAQKARDNRDEALREKEAAIEDLEEFRGEMANKSFIAKGTTRQIEEKANSFQSEIHDLRTERVDLQNRLDDKSREARRLQDIIEDMRGEAGDCEQKLINENELLRHENESALRSKAVSDTEVERTLEQLRAKGEAKDLLQTRHDALTAESRSLQEELVQCRAEITQLQCTLEQEKQQSYERENALRIETKDQHSQLSDQIGRLQRQLDEERNDQVTKVETWNSRLRELELQKDKAEQKANGLHRTVERLQESEGSLSSKESRLQEAIKSEKERHKDEETLLGRQIQELTEDFNNKRKALEESRSELLRVKEELRLCKRDQDEARDKAQALEDEIDVLQASFEEESNHAKEALVTARHEVDNLRRQLYENQQEMIRLKNLCSSAQAEVEASQNGLENQLSEIKSEKQALHERLVKANNKINDLQESLSAKELEKLRDDLAISRGKETEFAQKESLYQKNVHALKQEIENLEMRANLIDHSRVNEDSLKSLANNSSHGNEIVELRHLLTETEQQVKNLRVKTKAAERDAIRQAADSERLSRQEAEEFKELREHLEQQITNLQFEQNSYRVKHDSAEATIARLRDRVDGLTKDLHVARLSKASDETIAIERKDLHEMLKSAKLEAEDLQFQLTEVQSRIDTAAIREKDLRSQLQRARSERSRQQQRTSILTNELDSLRRRYEDKVHEIATQQQDFLAERKALVSRVRFPNMSISSLHGDPSALRIVEAEAKEKEKRHGAELKGLAKQIQWLRARFRREEGFRAGLAFEKRFLLMQIEMFQACNTADLRLLEDMGVTPDQRVRDKRPSLRAVGYVIIAGLKMQRMQQEWAVQRKIQSSLAKKMGQMRGGKSRVTATR